jgi:hypothetical protein
MERWDFFGSGPAAAHARQLKGLSESEGRMLVVPGDAEVGRVSPRPQDRGRSCSLLGRELLREAKSLGLPGRLLR